jgi:arylsulfatase A-like enzyme
VCTPTRYALLTGQHPLRIGRHVGVVFNLNDEMLPAGRRTVADVLRGAGYRTGMVGKWHLGFTVPTTDGLPVREGQFGANIDWTGRISGGPTDHGFDYAFGHFASADIPPYKFFENDAWVSPQSVWVAGSSAFGVDFMRPGWADAGWDPTLVVRELRERAVEFLLEHAGGPAPFFLYAPLPAPHTPTAPHPDFRSTTPHRYTDYVAEVDDFVGRLVAALETRGALAETLFVFASDNGATASSSAPDHRATGLLQGTPLRGQKGDAWEGGHRVPFIVRWGDGTRSGSWIRPGTVNHALVDLGDFFATAAALAGEPLGAGEGEDSFNLLPTLIGPWAGRQVRTEQFSTSLGGAVAVRHVDWRGREWKLIFSDGSGGGFSAPAGSVYTTSAPIPRFGSHQLYELSADPGESRNLLDRGASFGSWWRANALRRWLVESLERGRSAPVLPPAARPGRRGLRPLR